MMYAKLLKDSDRVDEATALLDSIISECRAKLETSPGDVAAAAEMAEALLTQGQAEQVRTDLTAFVDGSSDSRVPSDPGLAALYGRASIDVYDELTGHRDDPRRIESSAEQMAASDVDAETLLDLLADAAVSPATTMQAINRIARLSLSSHPAAAQAEEMVRNLRLDGQQSSQVLNLLGMHAIEMKRFDKAQAYLTQANHQTRSKDPMIVNNLAIAIIRSGGDSKQRALDLANTTLTLLPDHPDALSTRGEIYVAMEEWDHAIADLTQALKLRSNSFVVHRLLEKAYNGQSDFPMAAKHGERAVELQATPEPR
jgi:tetratricopeptide (TPR) repeat protein